MNHVLVMQCARVTSEKDERNHIDRRLIALEAMSAECSALLSKITIKQYHGTGNYGQALLSNRSRTLISI